MKIRVMPDFHSSGIWKTGDEGGIMYDPDEIDLSQDIRDRLKIWIDLYGEFVWLYVDDKEPELEKYEKLNRDGMQIAKDIKALHPDWHVEFWPEEHKKIIGRVML